MWYPKELRVRPEGTPLTTKFVKENFDREYRLIYAEFGIYRGATAISILDAFPNSEVHLFDFNSRIDDVRTLFDAYSGRVHLYGNSEAFNDSYNWSLRKLIERRDELRFDYCFLDGAHTFAVDALTYFLCDIILRTGGFIDFDDYGWRLRGSSLDPDLVPAIREQYTDEQIDSFQVKMIVDSLVRPSGRYAEMQKNKVFKKLRDA